MDAPFHKPPRVADECTRSKGRSEKQFPGYDEEILKSALLAVLEQIRDDFPGVMLVIQIARGRAAASTLDEVVVPLLRQCGIDQFHSVSGYRSTDYYCPVDDTPFVFLNYGMFAVLRDGASTGAQEGALAVGTLCCPVASVAVTAYDATSGGFHLDCGRGEEDAVAGAVDAPPRFESFADDKNILARPALERRLGRPGGLPRVTLLGLADHMPFVTPAAYNSEHVRGLLCRVR
jgi:hypothetical protein